MFDSSPLVLSTIPFLYKAPVWISVWRAGATHHLYMYISGEVRCQRVLRHFINPLMWRVFITMPRCWGLVPWHPSTALQPCGRVAAGWQLLWQLFSCSWCPLSLFSTSRRRCLSVCLCICHSVYTHNEHHCVTHGYTSMGIITRLQVGLPAELTIGSVCKDTCQTDTSCFGGEQCLRPSFQTAAGTRCPTFYTTIHRRETKVDLCFRFIRGMPNIAIESSG